MKIPLFDAHCDTAHTMSDHSYGLFKNNGHVDLIRAEAYSPYTQFFAIFIITSFIHLLTSPYITGLPCFVVNTIFSNCSSGLHFFAYKSLLLSCTLLTRLRISSVSGSIGIVLSLVFVLGVVKKKWHFSSSLTLP